MAIPIGVFGPPDSGKSFSRSTMRRPKEQFMLSTTPKDLYFEGEEQQLLVTHKKSASLAQVIKDTGDLRKSGQLVNYLGQALQSNQELKMHGNFDRCRLSDLGTYLMAVDKYMPHVKVIHVEDMTHYITKRITSRQFIGDTQKDRAYGRYLDVAADFMNGTLHLIENMREDLIVVMYYHVAFDEEMQRLEILTPGGKLLEEKALPSSYFDYAAVTRFITEMEKPDIPYEQRYRFIVRRTGRYTGRSGRALPGVQDIPNDLQYFIDAVRLRKKGSYILDHTPKQLPEITTNLTVDLSNS